VNSRQNLTLDKRIIPTPVLTISKCCQRYTVHQRLFHKDVPTLYACSARNVIDSTPRYYRVYLVLLEDSPSENRKFDRRFCWRATGCLPLWTAESSLFWPCLEAPALFIGSGGGLSVGEPPARRGIGLDATKEPISRCVSCSSSRLMAKVRRIDLSLSAMNSSCRFCKSPVRMSRYGIVPWACPLFCTTRRRRSDSDRLVKSILNFPALSSRKQSTQGAYSA
jgi:hypothetical protein